MRWWFAQKRTRISKERGQSLVEFAVILPLLMMILLGVLDLGRSFYAYIALTNATREVARYIAVNPTVPNAQAILNAEYNNDFSGCTTLPGSPTVSTGSVTINGQPTIATVTVTVSCQFKLVTPLIGSLVGAVGNQIPISSTATFAKEVK